MIWIQLSAFFVMGLIIGINFAKRSIVAAINKADICEDDKRMIRDVLGIPQNGER